ncbi:hypothetical protein QJU89_03630 [Pasteurella skyensis]|uniref:Intracellular growth attenuator protein IgaA n=1 Tax=Phocoenobacter skyensis TaxID=97481 RepID=A0AAJ6P009_9PAST|nr:hypothetical protein [Pasteurella skyensis]MDP8161927.1 hypothetical protein [Pasteurella skyensis]MDP8172083.1 hypothetical protein [Pasteurella skyensis]MDP8176569.1 hypothetical protein [Pasteurella skyensis]MDP8178457.1 hypothetical protein [Pasteurella skyensis]MDP8182787.1 hypothetical protein [Pasteurella skyensis]
MKNIIFVVALLLALYTLYMFVKHLGRDIKSRHKLKHPENVIRTISPQEKKYLAPHLKVLNLSLVSDEVYQLDNAIITADGYRYRGTEIFKMRANGIDISIPEPLDIFCKNSNTIEYVVAKFGMTIVAVAISVNGKDLLSYSINRWKPQPDEQILSTRYETATEYKARQSKEVYIWGAIAFLLTLVALLCASNMEDLLWFNSTMLLSGVMLVLMLFAIIKRKFKISSLKNIEKVKGTLQIVSANTLQNINIVKEVAFIGLNHPYIAKDKKLLELAQNTYYPENLATVELMPTKKGQPYELISLSGDKSIDNIYKNKTSRSNVRLIVFTLIALSGSIAFFTSDYSLSENFAYARSYLLNNEITKPLVAPLLDSETKTYRKVDELIAQPPKFGDRIELYNVDNLDVVLRSEQDLYKKKTFHIVENKIHLNPTQKYIRPVVPDILTVLVKANNHRFKQIPEFDMLNKAIWGFYYLPDYYKKHPITYPNDKKKEAQVAEEIVEYFEKMYAGVEDHSRKLNSEFLRKHFDKDKSVAVIKNPKRLAKLLDQACIDTLPKSCDKLYEELAKKFSNPPNNYLAGLYKTYQGNTIPVEEFKKLLQQDHLLIMPRTIDRFKYKIAYWAEKNIEQIKENGKFDLSKNRGGVILTGSKQYFASDYTSGFVSDYHGLEHWTISDEIAKIQKQPQSFKGVVTNISKEKDTLVINFIADRKYPYLQRQGFAIILSGLLSLLVFLITFIGYLLPNFYPRSKAKQTSGHLVE